MGARRDGREASVQFLYQQEILRRDDVPQALDEFWRLCRADDRETARLDRMRHYDQGARAFAGSLVKGVVENLGAIDLKIRELSEHWDLDRIAAVDRAILRVAVYEMLFRAEIPPVVTINEAIEIAKRYSTEESGRFVNGLLDRLRSELLRPARHPAGDTKAAP
jgi:N utilization substance protein B